MPAEDQVKSTRRVKFVPPNRTAETDCDVAFMELVADHRDLHILGDKFAKWLYKMAYHRGRMDQYLHEVSVDFDEEVERQDKEQEYHAVSWNKVEGQEVTFNINYEPKLDESVPRWSVGEGARLENYQQAIRGWTGYNFPDSTDLDPFQGMVEELGELSHARLKMRQHIRGDEDLVSQEVDAIGDLLIYMLDYVNKRGFNLDRILYRTWQDVCQRDWINYPNSKGLPKPIEVRHIPVCVYHSDNPAIREVWSEHRRCWEGYCAMCMEKLVAMPADQIRDVRG